MALAIEEALGILVNDADSSPSENDRDSVRAAIADTVAVAIAGWIEPFVARYRKSMGVFGGWREPMSLSRSADLAALESMSAHTLDFDDLHRPSATHLSSVLLPAVLAVENNRRPQAIDVVKAYVGAHRCAALLAEALGGTEHYERGWHSTATIGGAAAAFGISSALGLSSEDTVNAASIAATLASGSRQNFGSDMKPIQVGHAARIAVEAVALAENGFSADSHALSGRFGYLNLYGGTERALSIGLGRSDGAMPLFIAPEPKLYACCFALQQTVEAARQLRGVSVEQLNRISVTVSPGTLMPLRAKWPVTRREAQFSIPYVVTQTLRTGGFGLMDLPVEGEEAPPPPHDAVVQVSEVEGEDSVLGRVLLEIEADGRKLSASVDRLKPDVTGGPQLQQKIADCLSYAGSTSEPAGLFAAVDQFVEARDSFGLRAWWDAARKLK